MVRAAIAQEVWRQQLTFMIKNPRESRGDFCTNPNLVTATFTLSAFATLIIIMACQASETLDATGVAGTASRTTMIDTRASFFHTGFRM